MSSETPIISLRDVSKTYRAYRHPLHGLISRVTGGKLGQYKEFHALNGISLDIHKGETVGIIGRNGSGKSTLLQIICGIRKPTSGSITVKGRISALLELGSGFQPEFTGRENIYLHGAIMGFTREEMEAKLEDIAAFADIGEYLDQPIKTYSSGMYVRLAFAAAIHSDPDILILDEVLAVGDLTFQRKCFDYLGQLLNEKQRAVILVSHDMRQIERFCSRVILLQNGSTIGDGLAHEVCQVYLEQSNQETARELFANEKERARISSSGEAELLGIELVGQNGQSTREIHSGDSLRIKIRFRLAIPLARPEFIVGTQAADMLYLSSSSTREFEIAHDLEAGEHDIEYALDQFPLAPGGYFIRFGIRDENFRLIFAGEGLCPFIVLSDINEAKRPFRLLNLSTSWTLGGRIYSAK